MTLSTSSTHTAALTSGKASQNAIHSTIAILCIALIAILIGVFTSGNHAAQRHSNHYATSVVVKSTGNHIADSPMITAHKVN